MKHAALIELKNSYLVDGFTVIRFVNKEIRGSSLTAVY
jgi:hypothetical protein